MPLTPLFLCKAIFKKKYNKKGVVFEGDPLSSQINNAEVKLIYLNQKKKVTLIFQSQKMHQMDHCPPGTTKRLRLFTNR